MLKKSNRLKKKEEFKKVFEKGQTVKNKYLVLYLLNKVENREIRIAIAVSKKIGNAVVRNKIKRRLREAIKNHIKYMDKKYDIIFVVRYKIKEASYQEIEKNILALIKRAGLYKGNEL